jgi:3-oxoacyl-[acyl-carrier-protein] synthase-3
MHLSETDLTEYLIDRLREVIEDAEGNHPGPLTAGVRFADVLDSMAMVEFLEVVADDCECELTALQQCVGRRFSTVEHLAQSMVAAGLAPASLVERVASELAVPAGIGAAPVARRARELPAEEELPSEAAEPGRAVWLTGVAARLPRQIQPGSELDAAVGRPTGWLERRAGIIQRRVWADEDPIAAAADCAAQTLRAAGVLKSRLGALLTVCEAPPLSIGLAAAVHSQLGLRSGTPCYELGGACTGFLSAMSLARPLVSQTGSVLIVSVEAHSRLLPLAPGPTGEAAALFGDGCAAVLLSGEPGGDVPVRLMDLRTFSDGRAGDLIRVQPLESGGYCVEMEGVPLTEFALHALATATREMAGKHDLTVSKLSAIVAHGGNGRMPAMLARLLHVPGSRVWSDVARTGNLGSASVPVAWASRGVPPLGPVIWAAVGAGIVWGAALWEVGGGS